MRKLLESLRELLTRQSNRRALRERERAQIARSRGEIEKLRNKLRHEEHPDTRRDIEARIEERGQNIEERVERLRRNAKALDKLADRIKGLRARIRRRRHRGKVYTRAEWGAAPPRGSYARNPGVTKRVMHHTAYTALSPQATVSEEAAKMRTIQAGHFARGMTDIAYHRVVFPSGRIYEGRPEWAIGAHTLNENTGSVSVSADGNYEVTVPTEALVRAAREAFEGMPGANTTLYGHYQLGPTACPGKHLKARLNDIK